MPNSATRGNTLHDLSNQEFFERYPLDMSEIARLAAVQKSRRWRLEFDCNGKPFNWEGLGRNQSAAENEARGHLHCVHADFMSADARLVTCIEVAAS